MGFKAQPKNHRSFCANMGIENMRQTIGLYLKFPRHRPKIQAMTFQMNNTDFHDLHSNCWFGLLVAHRNTLYV